ncbi:MAG: biotin/lipoyl-binding protein [Gammaproteobacteria bacterium]|nr:biotin/lipoyl-binding protein [Gammaproteobacteria bacterium]
MRKVLLPVLLLLVGVAGFMALKSTRPENAPPEPSERNWPVAVVEARLGAYRPGLHLLGRVESPYSARLTAAVAAYVETLEVLEGQRVAGGDVLMTLEDDDYRLTVTQREAERADMEAQIRLEELRYEADLDALQEEQALLTLARRAVERAQDLKSRNVGTEAGVDDALQNQNLRQLSLVQRRLAIAEHDARLARLRAQLARVEAQLQQSRLDLERTRIRAPFNGRITATLVAPGDRVRAGDGLLEMFDRDRLEVRAQVPSRHQHTLDRATASDHSLHAVAHIGDQTIPLEFDRLAGRVVAGSGGLDALLKVPDNHDWLPVGQTVTVDLLLPPVDDTFLLPRDALYGMDRVYRVVDGRMESVDVTHRGDRALASGELLVLITSTELRSGDRVVVTQLPNAVSGLQVTTVREEAAPDPGVAAAGT